MKETEGEKRKMGKVGFVLLCVVVFIVAFVGSMIFKVTHKPAWAKKYSVEWSEEIGKKELDLSYGDKPANKFDLYLPKAKRDNYGLVVYLHAGGFTSGDKAGDAEILEWLCSLGYVAAGINYTLRTEENEASVYSQSEEIKEAIPVVIAEAKKLGYNIDEMAIAGGSAGHTLAMLYAYRDAKTAPVPVKLVFGLVGPSSFFAEDWKNYGLDQSTEAAAELFGVMLGQEITSAQIESGEYEKMMKPISAYAWVNKDSAPSVLAYGKYDKVQPFDGVRHLEEALKENGVDYKLFVGEHSGHGMQNDNKVYSEFMATVEEYLQKYMPV